jgi:predicted Fe-Mo cluster-binding NifX family protein
MRVAMPTWRGRISPVFDLAEKILIEDISNEPLKFRQELILLEKDPFERARLLKACGAEIVICCALSLPHQIALVSAGIRVISHICGRVKEVSEAIIKGQFPDFCLMPGSKNLPRPAHSKVFLINEPEKIWKMRLGEKGGKRTNSKSKIDK